MAREVALIPPDPRVHMVGADHSGLAATMQYKLLVRHGVLPTSNLLEIGCGIGRLVYELAGYLDEGTYAGFDISPAAIEWLDANYAPLLPNFRFDLVEVNNARYNRVAAEAAETAAFPYPDDTFDAACSFSVFTHMQMSDIRHYLHELRRVLAPGGQGLMTFFAILPEDESPALGDKAFVPLGGGAWTTNPELPERAIAFDQAVIEEAIAEAGLLIARRLVGAWHSWSDTVADDAKARLHKDVYIVTPAG